MSEVSLEEWTWTGKHVRGPKQRIQSHGWKTPVSALSSCFPKNLNCVRDTGCCLDVAWSFGFCLWPCRMKCKTTQEKQRNKCFSKPAPLSGESYCISVRFENQPRGMAIGTYLRVLRCLDKLGLRITVVGGGAQWHSPYLVCTRARVSGTVKKPVKRPFSVQIPERGSRCSALSVYFLECIF